MNVETKCLHMVSMRLDAGRLMMLGKRLRLPLREIDAGYLVHSQLGELFGDLAPLTFATVSTEGRTWRVLAYSEHSAEHLRQHADAFADPDVHAAVDWSTLASKLMPEEWAPGLLLGFEARVCPVVRKSSAGEHHRRGAEVDAFLARCWAVGAETPVQRESVYLEWFTDQVNRHGGVTIRDAQIDRYQRQRLVRRTQGNDRKSHVLDRPDVSVKGTLSVIDANALSALLRRGIGRHRAFGFGMILLKPGGSAC